MPEKMTPAQQKIAESLSKSRKNRDAERKAREAAKEIIMREKKFQRAKEIGEKYAPMFAGTKARYQPPLSNYSDDSAWIPDPREPSSPGFNDGLAAAGLRWRKHEIVVDRWKPPSKSPKPRPIPRGTVETIAACAALGLSYWCDAPSDRMGRGRVTGTFVWATDGHSLHLVNVKPKLGLTVAACTPYSRLAHAAHRCEYGGKSSIYTVPANDTGIWELTEPLTPIVKPETEPDLSITREVLQSAVAHIRHDNSYVTDAETAVLVKLRATRGTSFARDIMPLIVAELERRAAA
ncbi:Uncharacterised protein [Mycobacteroides abscessus subsp. abscessus]|uniref:DUF7457 domain-containing protein n=1 Tax=Mycobacteroides abscessus TaxID=36809 RepID=UPI00092BF1BF|nr:hypothetical protein [Mycobacteroides abscessus]SHT84331.1 Uncharacterised protein [Mycobacteroides abscessus subsp. abscessus]SKO51732.1 Uncharacterised protein [Mycobacteroides abscessus subsp. abscessus]